MKLFNGNPYFDKTDVNELRKQSIFYCSNPSDKHEFLYLLDNEERNVLITGINALSNTLTWEFTHETAINLHTIRICYESLAVYPSNLMSHTKFKEIPVSQITSYSLNLYENWLKSKGNLILYEMFGTSCKLHT
jgi:hypothetical protein